jgi:hypothetical protein
MTALSVARVGRIADDEEAMEQIRDGMANAIAALKIPEIEQAYVLQKQYELQRYSEWVGFDPPGVAEWENQLATAAIAEVAPAVAALLQAAVDKRLPWSSAA